MDKIKEEFEKWYSETIEKTVFSLDYEDDIKSYMFICYKSRDEELNKAVQDEKEACAVDIDNFIKEQRKIKAKSVFPEFDPGFEACMALLTEQAEAIRARTK